MPRHEKLKTEPCNRCEQLSEDILFLRQEVEDIRRTLDTDED